jgi:hypothetical protein
MASILKVDTIQDQDGNNIINENANVITVGASGDTVNIVGTLQNNGAAIPGDISSVVAGTGLSGGGTSGDVTLNIEAAQPTITSTGTLTNFTSTGIDDNATSTAITINSSEQVAFTDGTASLPSITNLGDENTGIFFPAADTIAFSEGGVEAMRIDSNGQLNTGKVVVRKDGASEIGQLVILNQSPDSNADLHFKGYAYQDRARIRVVDNASSTSGGSMKIETSGATSTDGSSLETRMLLDKNGNISFYEDTGTTPKMFWDATNENFGIGTTSPESTLHVVGTNQLFSPLRIQPQNSNGTSAFSIRQDATQDRLTLGLAYSSASVIIGNRVKPSNVSESDATGFLSSSTSNAARTAMRFDTGGHIQFYNAPQQATAVNSVVAMTERMRINSSGQTLIGTTVAPANANTKLMVHTPISSSSLNVIEMSHNTNGANKAGAALGLSIGNGGEATNAASLLFKTASGGSLGERMRITSSGLVAINTTSPDAGSITSIDHEGSTFYGLSLNSTTTSGTQYHLRFARGGISAGYITSNSATTIAVNNSSDERLKENIENSGSAIQDIKDIQVRQFDWIDNIDTHRDFGFVAQELVNVVPEAVTQGTDELDDNGKPVRSWGVDYSHIVPRLVKVCQEQQTKIEELEARILALETNQP